MKRIISKFVMAVLLAALTCGTAFAATAKVTYVKGKVEVSRGNAWVALKVGDEIKESETISTGFQSEARLNYNGSVMAVPALSRVTLETLQSSDSKDTVSLKVDTGAVRSRVTHTEGKRIEYTARTSVAVASVRGTDYTVFASGKVQVFEGAIAFYAASDYVAPAASDESGSEEEEGGEEPVADTTEAAASTGTEVPSTETPAAETPAVVDVGPATATTPAVEIAETAPKTTTVVGAGQSSSISKAGTTSKPVTEAKKRTTKAKTTVASAAQKDVITTTITSSGGAVDSTPAAVVTPEEKKTGTITVTVKMPAKESQ